MLSVVLPVVRKLLKLMEFRNTHPAFHGEFIMEDSTESDLHIIRIQGEHKAELKVDFVTKKIKIMYSDFSQKKMKELEV